MTIYDPLTPEWLGTGYTDKVVATSWREHAVDRLLLKSIIRCSREMGHADRREIVETSRWPYSVHIPPSGPFH